MEYRKNNPPYFSIEARKKISISGKGRIKSPEEIAKLPKIKVTPEMREKAKQTILLRYGGENIKKRKFNDDDASHFLSLLNAGWTFRKIARQYNTHHSTIKNTLILWKKILLN